MSFSHVKLSVDLIENEILSAEHCLDQNLCNRLSWKYCLQAREGKFHEFSLSILLNVFLNPDYIASEKGVNKEMKKERYLMLLGDLQVKANSALIFRG